MVAAEELLARFAVQKSHLRADQTPRPDLFIPPPNLKLSVTRHLNLSEVEIWEAGKSVARQVEKTLYGRADIKVKVCLGQKLEVVSAPTDSDPNHANVIGWPSDKAAQKSLAQELAARVEAGKIVPA